MTPDLTASERHSAGVPRSAVETSQGTGVLSYLISGVLLYGGLGAVGWWLLDQAWMVAVGVLVGVGLALVLIIRRYARSDVIDTEVHEMIAKRDRQREYWAAQARKSS